LLAAVNDAAVGAELPAYGAVMIEGVPL
jgi:hypothetical protein